MYHSDSRLPFHSILGVRFGFALQSVRTKVCKNKVICNILFCIHTGLHHTQPLAWAFPATSMGRSEVWHNAKFVYSLASMVRALLRSRECWYGGVFLDFAFLAYMQRSLLCSLSTLVSLLWRTLWSFLSCPQVARKSYSMVLTLCGVDWFVCEKEFLFWSLFCWCVVHVDCFHSPSRGRICIG